MIEKDTYQHKTQESALSGFKLFNVNAIIKSDESQLAPRSYREPTTKISFADDLPEDLCKNITNYKQNPGGKRSQRHSVTKGKDKHSTGVTIKEIIEDHQTGVPTQTEVVISRR